MKKPKQHHHFLLNLKKPDEEDEKKYGLTVSMMIKRSKLPDDLKEQYRIMLRQRLSTNRQFIKDIRAAKKPMMIHEKLIAEKWQLHADSLEKIKAYLRAGWLPPTEEDEEFNQNIEIEENNDEKLSE